MPWDHDPFSKSLDDMSVHQGRKGSDNGVRNFLRQRDGCNLQGVRAVHYTVGMGDLHTIPYFAASASAFLDA